MSSALGGMGDTDFGKALSGLAQASQDHAAELGGIPGGVMSSGGGGGGSGSGGGGKSDPFGGMFGGAANAPMGGVGLAAFGTNGDAPGDIWHTTTDQNIFQIVSTKIEKITPRVMPKP